MSVLADADRRDIQGLVTTGYGHLDHACFLLLDVTDREGGQAWLRNIVPRITTAAPWPKDGSGTKQKPVRTLSLALASPALAVLGLPIEARRTMATEFVVGMAARSGVLGDTGESDPRRWEFSAPGIDPASGQPDETGGEPRSFNALVVVYAATGASIDEALTELRETLGPQHGVVEVAVEHGAENTSFKEHFGFSADGLSQPTVEGIRSDSTAPDSGGVRTGEFVLGYLNEFGQYPPSAGVRAEHDPQGILADFPDSGLAGFKDFGRNGTYLVYRKLHQDVARFWRYLQSQTTPSRRSPEAEGQEARMVALAAKLMGRWPSGAPLVLAPDADDPALGDENRFLYRPTDPDGLACPVGSHIRRANPRDAFRRIADTAEESIRTSNQHRILRRSINYGEPLFPKHDLENGRAPVDLEDDGQPRGLHFMAINTDIQRQFEFIQETWLNNGTFNGLYDNKDPFIGDNDGTGTMTIQRRPVRHRVRDLPRFVHVRGGAYLFLPSITALRFLAGDNSR